MAILAEKQHTEAFLVSEAAGTRSREGITILAGSGSARALTAGMVLGRVFAGTAAAVADAGNTGDGTMGTITVSGAAKDGVYELVIIETVAAAGAFQVEDPDGELIGMGDVAAAFSAGGLAFTLADGATDFAAGDRFTITVTQTSKKFVQFVVAGTDGSQIIEGILRGDKTAPDGTDAKDVAFVRDCEVNGAEIVWPSGITAAEKTDGIQALAALGIIVR